MAIRWQYRMILRRGLDSIVCTSVEDV